MMTFTLIGSFPAVCSHEAMAEVCATAPALLVGATAAVEAASALGGLEGRGFPKLLASRGLDVVMCVEQERGLVELLPLDQDRERSARPMTKKPIFIDSFQTSEKR